MASLTTTVSEINDLTQWTTFLTEPADLVVIFFWAEFHEPSKRGGQMDKLFVALSRKYAAAVGGSVRFVKIDVEQNPEVVDMYPVTDVPTFVFLRPGKTVTVLGSLEGAHPAELAKLIVQHRESSAAAASAEMKSRLRRLTSSAPIMVFMKGIPAEPKCKFSRALVALLKEENVSYGSFNILEDTPVREALKNFSGQSTYPQVYQHGKLVGGGDAIREIKEKEGSLARLQSSIASVASSSSSSSTSKDAKAGAAATETKEELETRLKKITTQGQVVLFMKGKPEEPQCGFSRTMVGLLKSENIEFEHFDILTDDAVRQGLKIFSNWPTYPQLYVRGELQGGLDVIKEMIEEEGSLVEACEIVSTTERLKEMIASSEVFLFMKGDRETPRCGFSRTMIGILNDAKIQYATFDILSDMGIRAGIKKYSDWPTFPQLYVRNELIGGLDIVKEMVEEGDLKESLELE